MNYTAVKYSVVQRCSFISLSRPEIGNACTQELLRDLSAAFSAAQRDATVSAIIVEAEGESFLDGYDREYLRYLATLDYTQQQQEALRLAHLYQQVYSLRKPVITAVSGVAAGPGCGLAAVSDIVVASDTGAKFALTDARLGFLAGVELLYLARKISESRVKQLALTVQPISAAEALQFGLAHVVCGHMEVAETARRLADSIGKNTLASSVGLIKELFSRSFSMSGNDAFEFAVNLTALSRMTDEARRTVHSIIDGKHETE